MSPLEQFLWGFAGSAAIEIVCLHRTLASGKPLRKERKQAFYWVVRFFVALTAGLLTLAFEVDTRLLAFQIGAAALLVVTAFSKDPPKVL